MRFARRLFSVVAAFALVACGGFLGFGDDEDDEPIAGPGSEAGAETATGAIDADGGRPPGDAEADGDLGDVVIAVPQIDASVDAPTGALFPRLATFESGTLTLPNGADVDDGMDLLSTGALKGTYSARTKNASTFVGFTFAAKPPPELFVVFAFRFDALPPTQMPAAFFRLALANGENVIAAVQNDGDIYVSGGAPKMVANVQVGAVMVFGLHARVSPAALEAAVIAASGSFDDAVPTDVGWGVPSSILGSGLGELSGTSMRITVDQISFRETGFDTK